MKTIPLNRKKVNPTIPTFTGVKQVDTLSAQLFVYNKSECREISNYTIAEFEKFLPDTHCNWLNIHGIHEPERIKEFCLKFGIHDLAIQDLLDVNQRPKFQEFNDYCFFTLKSITPSDDASIEQEQLSFILGENYLLSFQERKADYFNHVRERLRDDIGLVRKRGSDYLLYLLLESILDNYVKTLNEVEDTINESTTIDLNKDPSPEIIHSIELFKRQIHQIKRTLVPIKEFTTKIEREELHFINKRHLKYFYELKDLCLSLIEDCEHIEVKLESSTNLFFSVQGHRMNQVMKTLTVIATIFIPLTFIAGIYGMNFSYMPELNWKWGYLGIWLVMIGIFIGMIRYFKKKKWY